MSVCGTLFDSTVKLVTWHSLEAAFVAASNEAVNTGAAILAVRSIRLAPGELTFFGRVAANAVEMSVDLDPPVAHQHGVGFFHATWASLMFPNSVEDLGYLLVHRPIAVSERIEPEENHIWISVIVARDVSSVSDLEFGAVCCHMCGRPISERRIKARPETRVCTTCKGEAEKKGYS